MQVQVISSLAFFPLAKKGLVPLLSDGCLLVRAAEPLAWSWCLAADRQNNPAHRGRPSTCSTLNSSPSNSSCCIVSQVHGGQQQPRKEPSFTTWLKKSQSALGPSWAWRWLCLCIFQGGQRWKKCTPFPWRFSIPFRLSSQKGANHPCPVTGNLFMGLCG